VKCISCDKQLDNTDSDFCSDVCSQNWKLGFFDSGLPVHGVEMRFFRQFVLLQRSFLEIIEFVDLTKENFQVYSDRISALIRNCGGEIDSICKHIVPAGYDSNIAGWRAYLEKEFCISNVTLNVPRLYEHIRPFREFSIGKSPDWWKNYTELKHNRGVGYRKANLKTALELLGALLLLNIIHLEPIFDQILKIGNRFPPVFDDGIAENLEAVFEVRGRGIQRESQGSDAFKVSIIRQGSI